jgi:hypothetical protein
MRSMPVVAVLLTVAFTHSGVFAMAHDSGAVAVVARYVQEHKRWKPSDYRIRRDRTEDHYIVFLVTYLPEQKHLTVGGGETFEAYYDPAKHKVIKEMHFQ